MWDEEHAAYRVLFERLKEGMHSRLMLDMLVTSAEYRELRARGQALKRLGLPPYRLLVKDQSRECQSVVQIHRDREVIGTARLGASSATKAWAR